MAEPRPARPTAGHRLCTPAAQRNREPIRTVLARVLPERGVVLEVASGSGEHAAFLAPHFPGLVWQPSDPDPACRRSIAAYAAECGNVRPPLDLDVTAWPWPIAQADAAVAINLVHISPWAACEGLIAGAGRLLPPAGVLYLYGPYRRGGRHTAPSNAEFDASLRQRNPAWGVRDVEAVEACARDAGFDLGEIVEMPANNLSLIFVRRQAAADA